MELLTGLLLEVKRIFVYGLRSVARVGKSVKQLLNTKYSSEARNFHLLKFTQKLGERIRSECILRRSIIRLFLIHCMLQKENKRLVFLEQHFTHPKSVLYCPMVKKLKSELHFLKTSNTPSKSSTK